MREAWQTVQNRTVCDAQVRGAGSWRNKRVSQDRPKPRPPSVRFQDLDGIRHAVTVEADSVDEACVLALVNGDLR
jgi:hypothetical protein